MKIVNLAAANLRSGKGAAVSLFVLIFLATLLLNVGMMVISSMNTFYDDKIEQLQDAHASVIINRTDYEPNQEKFLRTYAGVTKAETEEVLLLESAAFPYGEGEMSNGIVLLNAESDRIISPLKLVQEQHIGETASIYLPYSFKTSGGHELGDSFTITYKDEKYHFRIGGFFEGTMLGSNNMGMMKFLMPDAAYREMSDKLGGQAEATLLSAITEDSSLSPQLLNDFNHAFPQLYAVDRTGFYWSADIVMIKNSNTMTVNIIAMIVAAFALVIVLVSLLVIKFRVSNSIEDGMVNIGVLKALGYTSSQILSATLLQFMLITCSAGLVAVGVSYLGMPAFGGIASSLTGLVWVNYFNPFINLMSIAIVATLVMIVIVLSALRIRRLTAVAALRGGISTHNFKRNMLPIAEAKGGLQFILACKTLLANYKQMLMMTIIIAAVTYASVFSIVLYFNIAADKTAFIHLVGAETSDLIVQIKGGEDSRHIYEEIERHEGVDKVAWLDVIPTKLEGIEYYTFVSEDYGKLNNNTVFEGRNPRYDNEIALTWLVAEQLHKEIGDTVVVEAGSGSYTYLITGLSQSINYMGQTAALTLTGVQHLFPDYAGTVLNVYLDDAHKKSLIQALKENHGSAIADISDVDELLKSQTGMYVSAVFAVMVVILATTVLVVGLILYLVIKAMILKRKKELGILKAVGYTTLQLMHQMAWSFVPVVMIGVILGSVLGYFYTNPLLALLLSSAGIKSVHFTVNLALVSGLCAGLISAAYLVSLLVSMRIRKISAYSLITE